MKHIRLKVFFWGLFLLINFTTSSAQEQKRGKDLIQLAIGESNKWATTRYLLYTVTGPSLISGFGNERTFLIDKITGDCRFEGTTNNEENIILLFNYKSKRAKKYFSNSQEDSEYSRNVVESIIDQFFADTQILFLPALVSDSPAAISEVTQKIVNTEKLNILSFNNLPTLGSDTVNGKISLTSKGEIKSIVIDNLEYITSANKDIGGGILLPTMFEGQQNYHFQTVAAFTDIETGKFSNL